MAVYRNRANADAIEVLCDDAPLSRDGAPVGRDPLVTAVAILERELGEAPPLELCRRFRQDLALDRPGWVLTSERVRDWLERGLRLRRAFLEQGEPPERDGPR